MKKTLIGVFLIAVAICGIVYWEMIGRDKLLFSDIVVLNRTVEPHTEITEDMLSERDIYMPQAGVIGIKDAGEIIGMTSKQYIPEGAELFREYFLQPELAVDENADELVFSLETEKLSSFPRSIKKGDRIYIFDKDSYVLDTIVLRTMDGTEETDENTYAESGANVQIETIEIKLSEGDLMKLCKLIQQEGRISVAYN